MKAANGFLKIFIPVGRFYPLGILLLNGFDNHLFENC
jgi:hypothetical protein